MTKDTNFIKKTIAFETDELIGEIKFLVNKCINCYLTENSEWKMYADFIKLRKDIIIYYGYRCNEQGYNFVTEYKKLYKKTKLDELNEYSEIISYMNR